MNSSQFLDDMHAGASKSMGLEKLEVDGFSNTLALNELLNQQQIPVLIIDHTQKYKEKKKKYHKKDDEDNDGDRPSVTYRFSQQFED